MIPFLILDKIKAEFGDKLELPSHINMLVPAREGWQGSEHDLQKSYFSWLASKALERPELMLAHAVPNGGMRDKITAGKLKAEGVKSGVPDVFLPLPRYIIGTGGFNSKDYKGLYIEFKQGNNKPDEDQRAFCLMLDKQGYRVIVTNDLEIAIGQTIFYLGL